MANLLIFKRTKQKTSRLFAQIKKFRQKDERSSKKRHSRGATLFSEISRYFAPFKKIGNKKTPTEAPALFPLIDSILADDINYPMITEDAGPSLAQKPPSRQSGISQTQPRIASGSSL